MEHYETPICYIVVFQCQDVITLSSADSYDGDLFSWNDME